MEYTNNIYQKMELSKEVFSESQIRTLGQKQRKSNMNSDVKQYNL